MKHTRTYSMYHHKTTSFTTHRFIALLGAALLAALVYTGCPNPASPAALSGGSWSVTQDGGADGTRDTAALFFMFGEDPGALTADDITLEADTGVAIKGTLTGTGKNRRLGISVAVQGTVTVSITKAGVDAAPQTVTVYKQGAHEGIVWTVETRGHVMEGTTCIYPTNAVVITFSAPVENLTAAEIILNSNLENPEECIQGVPQASADKKVWTLPITYIAAYGTHGTLPVRIEKAGIQSKIAFVDFWQSERNIFTAEPVGGLYGTTATEAIKIIFTRPLRTPLVPGAIVLFNNEEAEATLGTEVTSLDANAGREWRVALSGVTGYGDIGVWTRVEGAARSRYIAPGGVIGGFVPVQVLVVAAEEGITFTVTADGQTGDVNTTVLTLTFSDTVSVLPQVRVTAGTGSAAVNNAGAATTDGGTTWTVPVTVALQGTVNVSLAPTPGLTRAPVSVTVHKIRSIKIANGSTELETHLGTLGTGSAESPATVALHSTVNLSTDWALVNSMVLAAGKYVTLDLSACTAPGNTITGASSPTGNHFNVIKNNQYLVGIKLPAGLVSVGQYAFSECTHIRNVDFTACAATLTSIGQSAFNESGLTGTLTLPGHITTIGVAGFKSTGITKLVLPAGITSLAMLCFSLNTALVEMEWPAEVLATGTANQMFQNCPLVKITMRGNNTLIGNDYIFPSHPGTPIFNEVYAAGKAEGAQGVAGVYQRTNSGGGVFTAWVRTETF